MKNDPKVYVELREQGHSNYDIAEMLEVDEASVRRGLKKAKFQPHLIPPGEIKRMQTQLEKPIRISVPELGGGAVTADWHHPLADYGLINTFIDHARDIRATNWLLVAGDWFHLDALSSFDSKQDSANLPKELQGSTLAMRKVLETFDRVYMSWGNHDARMHKTLGYKVPFVLAMQMMFHDLEPELLARIQFSNLDHIWVDTPRGPFYVSHPKAYTQIPLNTARRLASIHLAHVITGHSHHTAIGHDVSGKYVAAEIGGFFNASRTEYLQRTTTFPKWQNGWGFIDRDGWLSVEGQGWSSRMGRRV